MIKTNVPVIYQTWKNINMEVKYGEYFLQFTHKNNNRCCKAIAAVDELTYEYSVQEKRVHGMQPQIRSSQITIQDHLWIINVEIKIEGVYRRGGRKMGNKGKWKWIR
jgi:hypothetical protein